MTKRLTKHGNSLALVIEKPVLELLKINEKTDLEISIDGNTLIIRPANKQYKKKNSSLNASEIDKIAERVIEKYEPVLRKLSKT